MTKFPSRSPLTSRVTRFVGATACALVLSALSVVIVSGQQAGVNVNVLPIVSPDGNPPTQTDVAAAALRGDLYLNRQVEPTIAVSTRNPQHLAAFFVDYRAVDVPDDIGIGESLAKANLNPVGALLAKIFKRPRQHDQKPPLPPLAAASEAWVGMSRSDDGGWTWSGSFLPGAPFDHSPASLASPLYGLEAATDPVAYSGPCGFIHVAVVGFTRGGASKMVVATYQDQNINEGGENIFYKYTSVIETGNNATNGYFLDKPSAVVDIARNPSSDPCAHQIYVSYTTFNGLTKDGKFQGKLTFAKAAVTSAATGLTFSTTKINQPFGQPQGTALAVDPRPTASGGGAIYLAFRHFFSPDAIVVAKSTNLGQTFGKAEKITTDPFQAFDQPTFSTAVYPPSQIAFRSNGFPTIAVTSNGTAYAAWQERVDINPTSPTFRKPIANGSPRIVLMRTTNGTAWTDVAGNPGQRLAVDMADRDLPDDPNTPAPGFGALPMERDAGPQVMPKLSAGGGRLFLSYYESRGLLGPAQDTFTLVDTTPPNPGYISGIDRTMDVRAALLNPATGVIEGTSQVSRYPIRFGADLTNGETLADIEAVNAPCTPDDASGLPCVRRVNRVGVPHSSAGTSPFIGDYIDATPTVPFVPDGANKWKWAMNAGDVPYRAFRTIWADNRNQIPPTTPANLLEWQRYPNYSPPGTGGSCVNPGSRNADVFTSLVNAEFVVTAPTSYKLLGGLQRAFPISAQNATNANRFFRFSFENGGDHASFSQFVDTLDVVDFPVYAFSSLTLTVFVPQNASTSASVKVKVQEINGIPNGPDLNADGTPDNCLPNAGCGGALVPNGLAGTVVINLDPNNPNPISAATAETHTVAVNPFQPNPFQPNPFQPNPFQPNPFQPNITASNSTLDDAIDTGSVVDVKIVTWSVNNTGNTNTTYASNIKIDNPHQYDGKYLFQQVSYKTSTSGGLNGCSTSDVPQFQIIASVPMTASALDPFQPNPFQPNPFQPNPFQPNPFQPNSTLNAAPSDSSGTEQNSHDGTSHAPKKPDTIYVALIAYQIAPVSPELQFKPEIDKPAITVTSTSCDTSGAGIGFCPVADSGPDLVAAVSPSVTPSTLAPGGSFQFSGWTLKNVGNQAGFAEDGAFTHRVFLSSNNTFEADQDAAVGLVATSTQALAAGASQAFGAVTLTLPSTASTGAQYLILFIDDEREVSEVKEQNNFVAIPIIVEVPNTPPHANDLTVSTNEDTPTPITLTGSDAENNALTFTVVTLPAHGTLTGTAPNLTYSPAANYNGPDSLTYKVNDGRVDSATATVSISVTPVNDAPVAGSQTVTTVEDTAVAIALGATDIDSASMTFSIVAAPGHGSLVGTPPNVTYTPAGNYYGADAFTFRAGDGSLSSNIATVSITVTPVNDPPVANPDGPVPVMIGATQFVNVLANDTDVDGNALTIASVTQGAHGAVAIATNGGVTGVNYTASATFVGTDTFTYTISDGAGGTATASVAITSQFGFNGLLSPYQAPPKTNNAGSSVPIVWQYTNASGAAVDTSSMLPTVTFVKLGGTSLNTNNCTGGTETGPTYVNTDTPGNSFFQYFGVSNPHPTAGANTWQFNWQSPAAPSGVGCYNARVTLNVNGQVNGPFKIKLK